MRRVLTGPLRQPDFAKLWAGQAISAAGSQVTLLALPLTAVLRLDATAAQMGLLRAVQTVPFLAFGLVAGVWVDRLRRRPLLIGADLGRMLVLATIPAAAAAGVLGMAQLYVVGFLMGTLTLLFTVAYRSFLPVVVDREQVVAANSRLFTSDQVAVVAGPGVVGWLVRLVGGPAAIALDALSFGVSALFLARIRAHEPPPATAVDRRSLWREMGEGMRFIWATPLVRTIALATGAANLFGGMGGAVFVLFAARELSLSAATLGLIFTIGGTGGVLGALVAGRFVRRLGLGATLIAAAGLLGLATTLFPLAGLDLAPAPLLLALGQVGAAFGAVVYSINALSLLQACTPERLLGRMTASTRTITVGTTPLGALLGGAIAAAYEPTAALWAAAGGALVTVPLLWRSPVSSLRELPADPTCTDS